MKKLTTKRLSFQLSVVIIGGLLLVSSYSIINTYNKHIDAARQGVLDKLKSVTKTLSVVIDGDAHDQLVTTYLKKDEITSSKQDSIYFSIHQLLREVQQQNNIGTDIYLLFFNSDRSTLSFSVSSGDNPYYRHEYTSYPKEIAAFYDEDGTTIGPYTDDHGVWLSSFTPIKNKAGKTACIVQADMQFDYFINEARAEMVSNIIISVIVFLIISAFVLYTVWRLSKIDAEKNAQLADAFAELKVKNKDITDSINYALRIQSALIPHSDDVRKHLPRSFMFYEPKDVVSGDFPWFYKRDHYLYFAAVDCTGHGVPGAMMSIIGCLLLNDLANNDEVLEPGQLLQKLHQSVVKTLKQHQQEGALADGMDMAMCRIDLNNCEVHFAGAHRPLYHLRKDGELVQYKGSKYPIGGMQYRGRNTFDNEVIKIEDGDSIYFFSDGLPDQFGQDNRKFGPQRIRTIIQETSNFDDLKNNMYQAFIDWKGNTKQIDDILLIGVKF